MAYRAISFVLLLFTLPVAGCGTVANLASSHPEEGVKRPLGGVSQDLSCIRKAASGELGFKTHHKSGAEQYAQVLLMLCCAADLPLSLIGDIVFWPYTAAYSFINQPIPAPPVTVPTVESGAQISP